MYSKIRAALVVATVIAGLTGISQAQTPAPSPAPATAPPLFATTKVEGTDNVYIFRYQNHQAMFVVTPAGVIVTDPISYGRPEAAKAYLDEVRKITQAPIKYLIYSHHHYDHIAGASRSRTPGPL
jgi:glyoxylase-like metal-dependent hydrolase (beta-lactamase superfamily II)